MPLTQQFFTWPISPNSPILGRHLKDSLNHCSTFTAGLMPYLLPNQLCQSVTPQTTKYHEL